MECSSVGPFHRGSRRQQRPLWPSQGAAVVLPRQFLASPSELTIQDMFICSKQINQSIVYNINLTIAPQ